MKSTSIFGIQFIIRVPGSSKNTEAIVYAWVTVNGRRTSKKLNYLYNAAETKLKKVVTDNSLNPSTVTTHYLEGGFQYLNTALEFFPTSEDYVKNTASAGVNNYTYVFNYTDHLGNIRLSYALDPSDNVLKIMEETTTTLLA